MLRRGVTVLALLLLGGPGILTAQYFGQNKVQYSSFDFKIIKTEHFDIYFYERERAAALDAARMAERAYARLSKVLGHEFKERKPIILYASHSDFQQTNATPGEVGEGTGGFTDFLKHRNVMPLTGSYAEIDEVLTHEMVHQFQYDIWSGGRAGAGISTIIAVNPPLWFVEGMAAYLSRGRVDAETAMWLRDAALEGELPTIEQLETDPRVFPYRFGQALLAYVGERWGDEAIGAILQGSRTGGLESAFQRTLGISREQLSEQWRDAVQKQYLPEIGTRTKARAVATALLTEKRSDGTLHLAPALSPDGSDIAFFSEKDFFFVDLYLADGNTGKVKRRLLKSTYSSNYETFRFINSAASFSPDGKFLTFAAKRGSKDEIVVLEVARNRQVGRIQVDLNGVTTPSWSPDGSQLVFTGYDGGLSDLFVVNRDGSGLRRLTEDKYADFHPVWSPDGRSIAFTTDRGPKTDFATLAVGNMRLALYDLDTGVIRVLDHMEGGKNINPQWSPDGRSIAFVSDRTGVSNVFLYELDGDEIYQLTDFFTGAQGISSLSPVLSWARQADRLAFVYYEDGQFDIYSVANPRSLRRQPFRPVTPDSAALVASSTPRLDGPAFGTLTGTFSGSTADTAAGRGFDDAQPQVGVGGSIYRSPDGFRSASELAGQAGDSTSAPPPVSIVALLDSATLALPDTSAFAIQDYRVHFSPDYVARPSIGYTRDSFGRGFFGGSAISLSDILGNHQLVFAGYVNGRLSEAQVLAAYANLSHRINWAVGLSQDPYYFLEPSQVIVDQPEPGTNTFVTNIRRLVVRSAFAQASYPMSRYKRIEVGARFANVDDALLQIHEPYNPGNGFATADPTLVEDDRPGINYVMPNAALVFDNALFGWVGPFYGRRYRFEVAQTVGSWRFTQLIADYRRYDRLVGPFVLATRALYYGRIGRDAEQFRLFAGTPDLIRGNTSGSYRRHECRDGNDPGDLNTQTGCAELDRLLGTQIALASAELRFPLLNASLGFIPIGFPPIEGALFYDVGVAFNDRSTLTWKRGPDDDPVRVRSPRQTLGFSLRANILGFLIARADYSIPQDRRAVDGYWTLAIGPTF